MVSLTRGKGSAGASKPPPRIRSIPVSRRTVRVQSIVPDARFVYGAQPRRAYLVAIRAQHSGGPGVTPSPALSTKKASYLDISRYHLQLSQYHQVFPADQILVQVFEEMVADPAETVRAVCNFLGVDGSYTPPAIDAAFNVSSKKRAIPRSLTVARTLGVEKMLPWQARRWLKLQGSPLPGRKTGLTHELQATVQIRCGRTPRPFSNRLGAGFKHGPTSHELSADQDWGDLARSVFANDAPRRSSRHFSLSS